VIIPDVPGCFSAGATVAQAFENVKEALALHYEGLIADGDPRPQVREIDAHMSNPDYAGGVWGVVEFDITPYFG
jgi:predicted RNase H-like HicB family nuclease